MREQYQRWEVWRCEFREREVGGAVIYSLVFERSKVCQEGQLVHAN